MALTVVDDFTVINAADAIDTWTAQGACSGEAIDTGVNIEGSGSISARVNANAVGWLVWDSGAATVDKKNTHIFVWGFSSQQVSSADDGWRFRIATDDIADATWGEWNVGDLETSVGPYNNFHRWAIDARKGFDANSGTPPARTAIRSFAFVGNFTTNNGRISFFVDEIVNGTGITITGGASAPRGSTEVGSADRTAGRGLFKEVAGAFNVLGRVTIGDVTASTNSTFEDVGEVWLFEDAVVAGFFHEIEFVGGTGTNAASFGTEVGSGITAVGVGGNSFLSGGTVPFTVTATDADITTTMFGCNLKGPLAKYADSLSNAQQENTPDAYVEAINEANNDSNETNVILFPATEALGDRFYIGYPVIFSRVNFNIAVNGVGGVVAWDYFNGTDFAPLTSVTDGTTSFTAGTGSRILTFSPPEDWTANTINTEGPYFHIRARITTVYTTNPEATQIQIEVGGRAGLETANFKAVSTTFTQMDVIRIRSGAIMRKCTVTDSIAESTEGAIDLGDADPATDTFRDMQVQNCSKGILLRGTSTGTTAYNFRNIIFAGNTNDVRVDFPAAATIDINILEGGSTPTIDNVNGSTVNVNVSVTIEISGLTEGSRGVMIGSGGAEDGVVLLSGYADSTGSISGTYTAATPQNIIVRARNGGIINAAILDDGGVFTDFTLEARDSTGANDINLLPAVPAVGDAFYFGGLATFQKTLIEVSTAGDTYVITWEYWNGAWTALTVTDGTNSFQTAGWNTVSFTAPGDWATTTINSQGPFFFIRARVTTGGGTQPQAQEMTLNDTTKYLPFSSTGTIASTTGLISTAVWIEDTINP